MIYSFNRFLKYLDSSVFKICIFLIGYSFTQFAHVYLTKGHGFYLLLLIHVNLVLD